MDENLIKLGLRIKNRRLELGMTQADLSDRVGYTNKSAIGRVESGEVDLPLSKIKAFAIALDVSASYLMGWESSTQAGLLDRVLMYASKLCSLSDQDRAVVEGMIDALSQKGSSQK